jgi:multiple sugar transport system substrate-binding protein
MLKIQELQVVSFFDLETMKPNINNPGFVEALTDWVEATKYVPPGGTNFGLGDEIGSFGGGQTLFSFSWDDAFIAAMQDDSPIKNKVGSSSSSRFRQSLE